MKKKEEEEEEEDYFMNMKQNTDHGLNSAVSTE
jgi:hypothetical protein